MGWIRNRLGERTTAYGGAIAYMAALQLFPAHAALIHSLAGALGIGLVATPQMP